MSESLDVLTISASQATNAAGADSGWIMTAGVIIFFMQSGFALLESGSVRFKNYQNILLKNCLDACVGGMVWWAFGFAFAFGLQGDNKFIGSTYFLGTNLENEGAPGYGFWFFQFAFACTAATIVSGSLAERVNINNYILFSALMTGFIYPVVVAWTWGGGFLTSWGFSDFAGSGVVHLTGGISGLAGAVICGARIGKFQPEVNQVAGSATS
jgi:Amt family ammonium transporter